MSKKRKKQHKKHRASKPDEVFTSGPFQMARFGRHVVSRMNWAPGQFEAMQEHLAASHNAVIDEIDAAVMEAAQLVATLPALELLHRAWWARARAMLGIDNEFDIGQSEVLAERMVDYVQSLVAGCAPAQEQKTAVSDEDWKKLESLIDKIFSTLNSRYFVTATAKRRRDEPGISPALEEFQFQSQFYWANVKASQYHNHQLQALRELLLPQSSIIQAMYGVTSDALCDQLARLQHAQTFGISDAFDAMRDFHAKSMEALEADTVAGLLEGSNPREILHRTIERHGLRAVGDRAMGLFLGFDLLDVEKNTSLPDSFLSDFSWGPGEDHEFFADGNFRGWPLRVWPTFKRPFLRLGGRYYCFDSSTLFDHLYRQIEKRAFALGAVEKQRWIESRKLVTEDLPFSYLKRILPGARVIKGVYYKLSEDGRAPKWFELDGIITLDDHLFVVEVKAGAFTYTSPTTDAEAHINSLRALVADPAKQGSRFLSYLRSAAEVPLFDDKKNEIARLRYADYRHITVCAVTLDPFTEIAAQSQRLSDIGIAAGEEPVWSMSIDDIRVYADIFENPFEFLHFVEQRRRALGSKLLELDDELDHLGLYLKHNHYEQHARELVDGQERKLRFTGYRVDVDKFFSARMHDVSAPNPLRQEMPDGLVALLSLLRGDRRKGAARLTSYLLDLAGDWRYNLFGKLKERLEESAGRRVGPMSTAGEVRITLQPLQGVMDSESGELLLDHAKAMLVLNDEVDRLLLILHYDSALSLQDVTWRWVSRDEISTEELPRLQQSAEELRLRRLAKASSAGKVGRNDPCPCGSGKKFKKCCLRRSP
ncbi:SEC-C metal-binding domain-containing protein [Lysobacter soli]|uniref:SEC-C metal-binding domain-containing protein n=1 Tax=Lysobacter soli TaxID=453783 RepID=UPI00240F7FB3|nr:SEC-C metal-binding domain-containing protein [Lysobacter soli]MDG2517383.1 SEC-C metal-binding domain-containing protein [Lysobacter soli]